VRIIFYFPSYIGLVKAKLKIGPGARSCEDGNEASGSTKFWEILQ
jgi:hypothetical protein